MRSRRDNGNPEMIENNAAYTKDELAKALHISTRTVERHWMEYGSKIGETWLFAGSVLIRVIEKGFYDERLEEES